MNQHSLIKLGLTNHETPDIGHLAGQRVLEKGTFCSSNTCTKDGGGRKGKLVHVGTSYLAQCPKCGGRNYLAHERVAQWQVEKFHLLEKIEAERHQYANR